MLSKTLYVRVRQNRLTVRHIESAMEFEVAPAAPFTTQRLLVGHFKNAEAAMKEGFLTALGGSWFRPSPAVVIHPLEKTEGGLSEIEERILHELAIGAGAMKVVVWVGDQLSDAQVKEKLKGS